MPSINGIQVLPKNRYDELKKRVAAGADLYISSDNAVLSEFEALSGLHVLDSYVYTEKVMSLTFSAENVMITFMALDTNMEYITPIRMMVLVERE